LEPLWLVARQAGELVGGLVGVRQRQGWGERLASHYEGTCSGPLVRSDLELATKERVCTALLAHFARLRGWRTWTASFNLTAAAEELWGGIARRAGWQPRPNPAAFIPLQEGLDHVERYVFKKNRRNERNRSLKRGCEPGVTTDPEILAQYYPVYVDAARHWGISPTPLSLLRELLVRGEGHAFLTYVRYRGTVIGGHVSFHWGDRVTAWNGATLPEHNDKFPATLLIWTDIEEACRRGAAVLDLGASGGIPSLANFKKLLGASEEIRFQYEKAQPLYRWLRCGRDVWRSRGRQR
jgi:hypothetical protein